MDWKADKHFRYQAMFALCNIVLFGGLFISPVQESLDRGFALPLQYKIRDLLGKSPQLDPRIRILSFGDFTAAKFQKHDFRAADWAKILHHIDSRRPKAIFIDKKWALPIGRNFDKPMADDEAKQFIDAIRSLRSKLIVGGSVLSQPVKWLKPLSFDRYPYDLRKVVLGSSAIGEINIPWLPIRKGFPSGAHSAIAEAFANVGHIDYRIPGAIDPYIRYGKYHGLPHAGLLTAGNPVILDKVLLVDGQAVPLDRSGQILLNLPSIAELHARSDKLADHIIRNPPEVVRQVQPGDFVVVLPLMYTGNVDFVETPLGRVAGGYIPAAIINSVLTRNWLKPLNYGPELVLFAVLLSWLITRIQTVRNFIVIASGTAATVLLLVAYLFVESGLVISWLLPTVAFSTNSACIFGMRTYLIERRSRRLKFALQGAVAPEKLERLISSDKDFRIEPAEKLVTIMFIDLVGFSLAAEELSPQAVFGYLKDQLGMMTQTIHKHNGIVDKNLGDGIMCFFGDEEDGEVDHNDHANAALACAIDIQQQCLEHTLAADKTKQPIFPVRIGINTAPAYVGDIGDSHRIDFTLIGKGVNFASRLEAACEPYKIMLGTGTFHLASRYRDDPALHPREVQIKHFDSLFDAYEYNPFYQSGKRYNEALEAYRRYRNISRKHQRLNLVAGAVRVVSEISTGEIANISVSGMAAKFDKFLAKGVTMKIHLEPQSHPAIARMYELKLLPFTVNVCWGAHLPHEQCYLHGFQITSLNEGQKDQLFGLFEPFLEQSQRKASGG